jgi:hypothetical protein
MTIAEAIEQAVKAKQAQMYILPPIKPGINYPPGMYWPPLRRPLRRWHPPYRPGWGGRFVGPTPYPYPPTITPSPVPAVAVPAPSPVIDYTTTPVPAPVDYTAPSPPAPVAPLPVGPTPGELEAAAHAALAAQQGRGVTGLGETKDNTILYIALALGGMWALGMFSMVKARMR